VHQIAFDFPATDNSFETPVKDTKTPKCPGAPEKGRKNAAIASDPFGSPEKDTKIKKCPGAPRRKVSEEPPKKRNAPKKGRGAFAAFETDSESDDDIVDEIKSVKTDLSEVFESMVVSLIENNSAGQKFMMDCVYDLVDLYGQDVDVSIINETKTAHASKMCIELRKLFLSKCENEGM